MSLCFCSNLKPSILFPDSDFRWIQTRSRPVSFTRLIQPKYSNRGCIKAAGEEIGVLSPDDSLSVRNPVIEEEPVPETEEENGVASVVAEEKAQTWIRKSDNKEKVDEQDENASRFKLRNGREVFEEKAYLVGVACKGDTEDSFGIEESLKELAQLADTAGLLVVDSTYQKLSSPNPRTYIGSGKVSEIKSAIRAFDVETVIFDDELSPGQLRNLEKAFGGDVRVCDRTALILDIFNQRAATREASLQVSLAQMEYQLPRLTRMWTHLERQAGGQVKGMGEKQIEVDKRILRTQIGVLKKELESVRKHRKQYRNRRVSVPVPVVSLVGYTNAGKSTLLNRLTGADVLAEDQLFATLDPTTRRVQMKNGKEFLLTDTVGFIQKLPTTLVAAFRATLEEIAESSILVHVVDISHPLAEQQIEAVEKVLSELDTSSIPKLMLWNKVDKAEDPEKIKLEAKTRNDVVCVSALTGEGLNEFCNEIQNRLKDAMVWVEALIPFDKGELLSTIHQVGMVERTEYTEKGPKGGIHPSPPRAHSYNDLKELLGSLRLRFDAAKEAVNTELGGFLQEVVEIVQKNDSLPLDGQKMADELVVLAKDCIKMTCLEFRSKCEPIVQDLTIKRQECQTGLLKWLLTRMLFILTRCTRVLHFAKDSEPVDETSLAKLKECLNRIPSVKTDWVLKRRISDMGTSCKLNTKAGSKCTLEEEKTSKNSSHSHQQKSEFILDGDVVALEKDSMFIEPTSSFNNPPDIQSNMKPLNNISDRISGELGNECRQQYSDDSNLVICRICEELVPTIHLEPHSYICAYADKCDSKSLDVDERLLKFAELLEQLVEATSEIQENSKLKSENSGNTSEGHSPNMGDWRSKGIDGMFEDLHEMDTASIEDSPLAAFNYLKSHLGTKLNNCGPPSSNGSMTSVSSTNTPRAVNFEFWLDHNNLSELEDVQQMADLADIARCVAGADLSEEGSHELLIACMQDLQDILQNSKLKALVVDTFGGRVENLLREKYVLACDLVDRKDGFGHSEGSKMLVDNSSHSSIMSTPSSLSHKERTSIDDFEIIKPISRGAFGRVFLARKRSTGDLFAIKVLKKLDLLRKNDIERILAERNILITVRNPFVVRFFYSFTSRDYLYLVMEYLNGGDLFSLLKKIGCLEEDVARTYVAELVLALEYLHSLGIVHRDLKPDNILIAQDGHIKLTDFGLSKIGLMNSTDDLSGPDTKDVVVNDVGSQYDPDLSDKSQRSAVGTPDYLAPEILLGTEHGSAADWWSVGIILFELITGIPPFNAEHPEVIFDNILNKQIPWPSVPEEMSFEARDLIDRLLVHDPNQRLGAKGASEVKAHQFFRGVDWDNLSLQKAAFVPQTDGVDDTSYFVSRYGLSGGQDDEDCNDSASDTSEFSSNFGLENIDECGDLAQFDPSPLDLSLMNFSFKNLSQLASINHDMLLQSGFDSSRCSSPCKGPSE